MPDSQAVTGFFIVSGLLGIRLRFSWAGPFEGKAARWSVAESGGDAAEASRLAIERHLSQSGTVYTGHFGLRPLPPEDFSAYVSGVFQARETIDLGLQIEEAEEPPGAPPTEEAIPDAEY